MPAKSQAQARWAGAAYKRGELTRGQLRDFVKGVNIKRLPKRVDDKDRKRRALRRHRYKGR